MNSETANDSWWQVDVIVPDALVDDIGALFIEAGALGCEQLSTNLPPPAFNTQDSVQIPTTPQNYSTLRLCFADEMTRDEIAALTLNTLTSIGVSDIPNMSISKRNDTDWATRWQEHFPPLQIGKRVVIIPSWEKDFQPRTESLPVILDPGLAFGTGQHATTALCVELIEAGLDNAVGQKIELLDVGCGSGILAIVAAILGCQKVIAIDNDPTAVKVAYENIMQNGVGHIIETSEQPLMQITGTFNWVVANILAQTLIELAMPLVSHTEHDGSLVLSGILHNQENEVLDAIAKATVKQNRNLPQVVMRLQRDEWVALQLRL
ncbi:MAG: 50S ribosomal protein L11 methyltransferase [Deltaproteobacteria bacterium]|nr:50S ribosomal protein L11 methyltransferase [Deltaproteobacteria bacterium]